MGEKKIIVFFLQTGKRKIFKSIEDVVKKIPALSAGRIKECIKTGKKWRTMAFDEVEE